MTRIGNVDRALLLIREKLQRMDRNRLGRTGRSGSAKKGTERPLARLQAGEALDQLTSEEFRRTLVRAVLTEELGDGIANDSGFQPLVEDVWRLLNESEEGRELIERAVKQMRSSG